MLNEKLLAFVLSAYTATNNFSFFFSLLLLQTKTMNTHDIIVIAQRFGHTNVSVCKLVEFVVAHV